MNADQGNATWLEIFENGLYERLETETDPEKARIIMETIATGRTEMSDDGFFHGNGVDSATFARIAKTQCPVAERYREKLRRWGADPVRHPLEPYAEWAMHFACSSSGSGKQASLKENHDKKASV